MAGHSKWNNIKHRKAAQDKKKTKLFTKILKDIQIAVKHGGTDVQSNSALRLQVQNARGANIPKETVDRVIAKASGAGAEQIVSLMYECYGTFGTGIIIEAASDNTNRTISNIRAILNKFGGSLATKGSLNFVFTQQAVFELEIEKIAMNTDELELELIDSGAEEMEKDNHIWYIFADIKHYGNIQKKLENLKIECKSASLQYFPNVYKNLQKQELEIELKIIDKFEDDEDITAVYHNLFIEN